MLVRPNATNQQWSFISLRPLDLCATIPTTGGADTATLKLYDHKRARRADGRSR